MHATEGPAVHIHQKIMKRLGKRNSNVTPHVCFFCYQQNSDAMATRPIPSAPESDTYKNMDVPTMRAANDTLRQAMLGACPSTDQIRKKVTGLQRSAWTRRSVDGPYVWTTVQSSRLVVSFLQLERLRPCIERWMERARPHLPEFFRDAVCVCVQVIVPYAPVPQAFHTDVDGEGRLWSLAMHLGGRNMGTLLGTRAAHARADTPVFVYDTGCSHAGPGSEGAVHLGPDRAFFLFATSGAKDLRELLADNGCPCEPSRAVPRRSIEGGLVRGIRRRDASRR